jgi:hypothetical protein
MDKFQSYEVQWSKYHSIYHNLQWYLIWYLDLICKFPKYLPNIGYDLVVDEPQQTKLIYGDTFCNYTGR